MDVVTGRFRGGDAGKVWDVLDAGGFLRLVKLGWKRHGKPVELRHVRFDGDPAAKKICAIYMLNRLTIRTRPTYELPASSQFAAFRTVHESPPVHLLSDIYYNFLTSQPNMVIDEPFRHDHKFIEARSRASYSDSSPGSTGHLEFYRYCLG